MCVRSNIFKKAPFTFYINSQDERRKSDQSLSLAGDGQGTSVVGGQQAQGAFHHHWQAPSQGSKDEARGS